MKERKCLGLVGDRQQGLITEGSVGGVRTPVERDFEVSKRLELGSGHSALALSTGLIWYPPIGIG